MLKEFEKLALKEMKEINGGGEPGGYWLLAVINGIETWVWFPSDLPK